jgi:hypothetical protein
MNGKLKTKFGEREKAVTIWNGLWDERGVIIKCAVIFTACACSPFAHGQSASPAQAPLTVESPQEMQARITKLEAEVSELKAIVSHMQPAAATAAPAVAEVDPAAPNQPTAKPQGLPQTVLQPADSKVFSFLRDTTINVALDGYYAYNFNNPIGRVNLLRAYDVLSNDSASTRPASLLTILQMP